MKTKKIVVIGNSVSVRIRPRLTMGKTYSDLLQQNLQKISDWKVFNMGMSRRMAYEFLDIALEIKKINPEYTIINLGCVEAPNRDIPLWFSDIIFERKHPNLLKPAKFIYKHIFKGRFRSAMVFMRGKTPWVNAEDFKLQILHIVKTMKNLNSKIIVLGINKGNDRIEKELPGTLLNYERYNEILREVCINEKIPFVDVSDLEHSNHFPDGVHYNIEGHKIIGERLYSIIADEFGHKN